MILFYDPAIIGNIHILNEEESFHCTKVLRLKEGDGIHLTNGKGEIFEATITQVEKKTVKLKVERTIGEYGKRSFHIHIAFAPTKNIDRFEWFLEKATEIGIDEITPIICEHSERSTIKHERQERVIIAAMKQSLKAYKPILNHPINFKNFIAQTFHECNKYIAVCEADNRQLLKNVCPPNSNYLILIGPEGDFSSEELVFAKQRGFQPVSLGTNRLRTETAGVVACHIGNLINDG
jgi:16S rRNA (uracil1498-N3)-methyltransferase